MHQVSTLGLEITPLWNLNSTNISQPCFVNESFIEDGLVTMYGSQFHTCSLQLAASKSHHIIIEVLSTLSADDLFYVERLGDRHDCSNKYVVIKGNTKTCNITFKHNDLQLNLRSNTSIFIREISARESPHYCPESYPTFDAETGQIIECTNLTGYDSKVDCMSKSDLNVNTEELCKLNFVDSLTQYLHLGKTNFTPDCNATIGKRYVTLQCSDFTSIREKQVLLIYPLDLIKLDLSHNGIVNIDIGAFEELHSLQELHLNNNSLVALQSGVFHDLRNLNLLILSGNQLDVVSNGTFQGLTKLVKLFMSDNSLSALPTGLFTNLVALERLALDRNLLKTLNPGIFHSLSKLKRLDLGFNRLNLLPVGVFDGLSSLTHLRIRNNMLTSLSIGLFKDLKSLTILLLRNNKLKALPVGLFDDLGNLVGMSLEYNLFTSLDPNIFNYLQKLERLGIHYNKFEKLPSGLFDKPVSLQLLRLNGNKLKNFDDDLFRYLDNLSFLDISDNLFMNIPRTKVLPQLTIFGAAQNPLLDVNHRSFIRLNDSNKTRLLVSQHEICQCYAPKDVRCIAEDDRSPYLTCDRLLSDRILVVVMWLIGLNALAGNLFVIVWKQRVEMKQKSSETVKVQSILLSNLALSDFLMGVYMLIIASADIYFGDNFPLQSERWRSSVTCTISGTLAITSSEASVFFVMLISIDRYIHIKFPFSSKQMNRKKTKIISGLTWLFAVAFGLVPSLLADKSFKFYDKSHVCIGFPLVLLESFTKHPLEQLEWGGILFDFFSSYTVSNGLTVGLYYSVALFLGLNCMCYLMILGCYIDIVRTVRTTAKQSGHSQDMKQQVRMTMKVTAIVATDFFCWFPIIILGILVQTRVIILKPSVYAWLVTCVLPLNSAINPYLYTISEVVSDYRKKTQELTMQTQSSSIPPSPRVTSASPRISSPRVTSVSHSSLLQVDVSQSNLSLSNI